MRPGVQGSGYSLVCKQGGGVGPRGFEVLHGIPLVDAALLGADATLVVGGPEQRHAPREVVVSPRHLTGLVQDLQGRPGARGGERVRGRRHEGAAQPPGPSAGLWDTGQRPRGPRQRPPSAPRREQQSFPTRPVGQPPRSCSSHSGLPRTDPLLGLRDPRLAEQLEGKFPQHVAQRSGSVLSQLIFSSLPSVSE